MFFFLISFLSFLIILSKSLPLQPLPPWASETRLLSVLFWRESLWFVSHWLRNWRAIRARMHCFGRKMSSHKKRVLKVENVEEMSVLDLPELPLEVILGKLSPTGLCSMAGVCSNLRDRCRSDHLWEKHMREKWVKLMGRAARREWEWFLASRKDSPGGVGGKAKPKGWTLPPSWVWPLCWFKSRLNSGCKERSYVPRDSIMSCYLALESGKFSFPAQVYNREHGHVGFMLSCYDAELSYDCHTDMFQARYPPHGRRTIVIEEGVQWDRLRAPPIDTSAHDLHISDCLNELRPGDHIEIQWRRNKEFPYGWWYGVVGHLETCDGNEYHCCCHSSDTVILEFNQYTPGSRWRRSEINRTNHREKGNESDGFYGGIRKLYNKEEIAMWRQLWPTDVLE